jgi:hypothetical protein
VSTPADATLVRVEKGAASDEELAALTAVLLARASAQDQEEGTEYTQPRSTAGWRRLERQSGFPAPHSWRS